MEISIHALLAESDRLKPRQTRTDTNFYPRSPCGERQLYINRAAKTVVFLSTLSLRRATKGNHRRIRPERFLSTLSLRRATYLVRGQRPNWGISIHALLAESDFFDAVQIVIVVVFLSTLSLRRATFFDAMQIVIVVVFLSTLSLRRATRH